MRERYHGGGIKVGDMVIRMLGGVVPMRLRVTRVTAEHIYTAGEHGWKFRRDTGGEVDEGLGWDGLSKTGSYLVTDCAEGADV